MTHYAPTHPYIAIRALVTVLSANRNYKVREIMTKREQTRKTKGKGTGVQYILHTATLANSRSCFCLIVQINHSVLLRPSFIFFLGRPRVSPRYKIETIILIDLQTTFDILRSSFSAFRISPQNSIFKLFFCSLPY